MSAQRWVNAAQTPVTGIRIFKTFAATTPSFTAHGCSRRHAIKILPPIPSDLIGLGASTYNRCQMLTAQHLQAGRYQSSNNAGQTARKYVGITSLWGRQRMSFICVRGWVGW
jgi:hypothetical protein